MAHVASEEMTVFFSSHQIAEVEQIADHVAIIDRGRTVVAGALDDLRENFRRVQLVFDGEAPDAAFHAPGVERVQRKGRVLTVLSSAGAERILEEARALNPMSVDVDAGHAERDLPRNRSGWRTDMLWYKSWLETRWRFLIGLALLHGRRGGQRVRSIREVVELLPQVPELDVERRARPPHRGSGRAVAQLPRLHLVAVVPRRTCRRCGRSSRCCSAPAGCSSQAVGRRRAVHAVAAGLAQSRSLGVRAATGLAELLVLALVPSLLIAAALACDRPELQRRRRAGARRLPVHRRRPCSSA